MAKPAGQTSSTGAGGAGDAVTPQEINLEVDLGDEGGEGGDGTGGDGGDGNDGGTGTGLPDPSDTSTEAVVARALAAQETRFNAELDRRVNSAVDKVTKKLTRGKAKDDDEDDEGEDGDEGKGGKAGQPKVKSAPTGATSAQVRGARVAFREYLPDEIKILGTEEREIANELGLALIGSAARKPIDDDDELGEDVAKKVAAILKKARSFYSARTQAVLQRQGVVTPPANQGQSSNPGAGADTYAKSNQTALEKDRELFPDRYNPDGSRKQ